MSMKHLSLSPVAAAAAMVLAAISPSDAMAKPSHNVILFVTDGLRSSIVTSETAPTMAALRRRGVDFHNSHSLFPTVTTANASAFATGHGLGDSGDFGNALYVGFPLAASKKGSVAPMENDAVLLELNAHYADNYLGETTVFAAARAAGYSIASIGKLGPVLVQDVAGSGNQTILIDDRTGSAGGVPVAPEVKNAILKAGLALPAPGRGDNDVVGDFRTPGTRTANVVQGAWFADVATKVVLPKFIAAQKPFVMVLWSRDPDGTQHGQGDSLGTVKPGINGPTSLAGIRNADNDLAELLASLKQLGLDKTTDVVVVADHGFSTISKESATSPSAGVQYSDVSKGQLPPGFLGIDLAVALDKPLSDGRGRVIDWRDGHHPASGESAIGDPAKPEVIVAANGGADLIYLPQPADQIALAKKVVEALWSQDYTGAVFVKDSLGPIAGTLPMSAVGLMGTARTPTPDIVVSFRSTSSGCADPELCAVEVADTSLQQGQGIHGSLSRANTHNFMAAIGPDFRKSFVDPAPASNADIGRTLFALLGLSPKSVGHLKGRVLSESLRAGASVSSTRKAIRSTPSKTGLVETLEGQTVGDEHYLDAAGVPGRAVGVRP